MKLISRKLKEFTLHVTDGEHGSVVDDPEGSHFLLSNKNIIKGKVVITEEDRRISKESFLKINKRTKLSRNDVVISTVGTIGKVAIIDTNDVNFDFQRSVGIIKCDETKLAPEYLAYYLNQDFVQKRLYTLSKGAVQRCLFISDLKDLDIHVPENFNEQMEVVELIRDINKRISINYEIIEELEGLGREYFNYTFFNERNDIES